MTLAWHMWDLPVLKILWWLKLHFSKLFIERWLPDCAFMCSDSEWCGFQGNNVHCEGLPGSTEIYIYIFFYNPTHWQVIVIEQDVDRFTDQRFHAKLLNRSPPGCWSTHALYKVHCRLSPAIDGPPKTQDSVCVTMTKMEEMGQPWRGFDSSPSKTPPPSCVFRQLHLTRLTDD